MNLRELLASYNSGVMRARQEYALQGADACGTVAGYRRHKRAKTRVCLDCTEAYNAHRRAIYHSQRGQA